MSFWRKGKSLIIRETVKDGSNGIDDAGETQQEKEGVSHALHPGELSLEEDIAGGLGRHLGVASTTFLMFESSTHVSAAFGKLTQSAVWGKSSALESSRHPPPLLAASVA